MYLANSQRPGQKGRKQWKGTRGHRGQEKMQQRTDFMLSPLLLPWRANVTPFGENKSVRLKYLPNKHQVLHVDGRTGTVFST